MKKEEYLKILTEQIRCKMARPGIETEIRRHIEDQEEAYLGSGMNALEAEEAAVAEMGDPAEAGIELDRVHRPGMDWTAIGIISFLYLLGVVFRNLLQNRYTDVIFQTGSWWEDTVWVLVGITVMIAICYVDYSRIVRYAKECYLILFALLFIGTVLFAMPVNGGYTYIRVSVLGVSVLNVKMLISLFVPLYGGVVWSYHGKGYAGIFKCILWMLLPLVLCCQISSIVTMCILYLTFTFVLMLAVYKEWFRVKMLKAFAGTGAVLLIMPVAAAAILLELSDFVPVYFMERLRIYLDPMGTEASEWLGPLRENLLQSSWLGQGSQEAGTYGYPSAGSDYFLSYLILTCGILTALLLCGMIIFLFSRLFWTSLRQKNQAGVLMGAGCAFFYLMQFLMFVLMNLGILPGGSVYCPFLTFGKSGLLVSNILLGIMLSIYRYRDIPLEKQERTILNKLSHS